MKQIAAISIILLSCMLFAPPVKMEVDTWAQSKFDSMTVDQRIAQLFMIEVRPTYGETHLKQVEQLIRNHEVGGLIFFKGDPLKQVRLTNKFQSIAKTPMFIAIDGEWGLAMRLSGTISFPYQLGLGGIKNKQSIFEMGKEIGRQCKRMGVHINFAPVIDVNNNPNNPVINYRSFGEDPMNVAEKGWAYASGMQEQGVMACAKHFPGHGDTDVDSHKELPVINHSMERLRSVEFVPFRYLIDHGVQSVMTAHLYIPAIDNTPKTAISISDKAINGILRNEMGFLGLAFTDALNMQGVAKYHPDGELELKALKAGNDVLLAPSDIPKATALIKKAMRNGSLKEDYVWAKVKKILAYKEAMGLHTAKRIDEANLIPDLNSTEAKRLLYKLAGEELCLLRDNQNWVPLKLHKEKKIALLAIGNGSETHFQTELKKYQDYQPFRLSKNASSAQFSSMYAKLKGYDAIVVSVHETSKYPSKYGLTGQLISFLNNASSHPGMILIYFGNPYALAKFKTQPTVLLAYEDEEAQQVKAAQALYGHISMNAKLSVSVNSDYQVGDGLITKSRSSFLKVNPEEVGMSPYTLSEIDKIALHAIYLGATPGMQILVAKEGKVVYHKSFGKHTYRGDKLVQNSDLYDLASITKVGATTLSIMKLVEEKQLNLDDPLAKFLPELLFTDKASITIRQVLLHKSGLKDWIPFYRSTTDNPRVYDSVYSSFPDATHNTYVGNGLYMLDSYKDEIFKKIYESPLGQKGKYKYSDLGMIMMKELLERVTGSPLDQYVYQTFYKPMGIERLTFLPLDKFDKDQIVPTAYSPDMRKGVVQGIVHDPAAAMLGGVSGHAGLFGNAESLAMVMQMLLNKGVYNDKQFLNSETIAAFTKYQASDSRRGLGWDKPENSSRRINPASDWASGQCFGHSGFTGTIVWADPKYDLVYVFLSNRVYPDQNNKKLIRENVRSDIMDKIYESFLKP